MTTALVIFLITYIFIGLRQIPRLHIDRPAGALVGAVLMIVFGVLTLEQAFDSIDMHTLLLLLGMMIITVYLRHAGFFELMADKILSLSRTPLQLPESLGGDRTLWLALAMSSTLAGNLTLIGSVANLIVAQQARKRVEIGFMEYFRAGALITVITLAIGILVLALEVRMAHGAEGMMMENRGSPKTVTIEPSGPAAVRIFHIVLLCDTDEARTRGLQGFRQLKRDEAALFVFPKPEAVTFWMGSVAYPIDIIFVEPDKRVVRVYPDRKPGSRDYYPSIGKVQWVVETAAGSGIRVGDRVRFE